MRDKFRFIYTSSKEKISGLLLIEPKIYHDERGFFLESWNKRHFENILNHDNQKNSIYPGK